MDYMAEVDYLPLAQCVRGGVYRLLSRNLDFGVFDGEEGFVGVRYKCGDVFLFTEYHWDNENHHPYGTVKPLELVEMLPEGVEPQCYYPVLCSKHDRPCHYEPGADTGWVHSDDGTCLLTASQHDDHPVRDQYEPLFDYLREFLRNHPED